VLCLLYPTDPSIDNSLIEDGDCELVAPLALLDGRRNLPGFAPRALTDRDVRQRTSDADEREQMLST
jgi:hypothetical protein